VAATATAGNVTGYACDGKSVAERFDGRAEGTTADLTSSKGARLRLELADAPVTGTLTVDGEKPVSFSIESARGKPATTPPASA
jgi:hypothetical protein